MRVARATDRNAAIAFVSFCFSSSAPFIVFLHGKYRRFRQFERQIIVIADRKSGSDARHSRAPVRIRHLDFCQDISHDDFSRSDVVPNLPEDRARSLMSSALIAVILLAAIAGAIAKSKSSWNSGVCGKRTKPRPGFISTFWPFSTESVCHRFVLGKSAIERVQRAQLQR